MIVREIEDFIVFHVPPGAYTQQQLLDVLHDMTMYVVLRQYRTERPTELTMDDIEWLITADVTEVENFQLAHRCATSLAGHDQAIAHVREHPDQVVALANLRYTEVWM
jgi:hypothetical protein